MKTNRNWWPHGIIAAFLLFFAGMASVVLIASTHREHLVNANYYEQELKFQTQIDAGTRAQQSGATIVHDSTRGFVIVQLPGEQPAGKVSGTIELYRPSEPKLDRELPLELRTGGTQMLDVSRLAPGLWVVRAQWIVGGEKYFLQQKITIAGK